VNNAESGPLKGLLFLLFFCGLNHLLCSQTKDECVLGIFLSNILNKCIFSWHFSWFLFCFEICGLLTFCALHSDMYNEDSRCFVHGLMQAAVGGNAPLVLFVHCSNMCVRWFFLSKVLKCVFCYRLVLVSCVDQL